MLVGSVMCLYEEMKSRVRVDSELSEEFKIKVGMHQGFVPSPFLFVVVLDVVTELAGDGVLSELLYADDLFMMSEIIKGFCNKFMKCREAFDSDGSKVSLGKYKLMVSGIMTKDGLSKTEVDPCGVCSLRVKANSILCVHCKRIYGRCS